MQPKKEWSLLAIVSIGTSYMHTHTHTGQLKSQYYIETKHTDIDRFYVHILSFSKLVAKPVGQMLKKTGKVTNFWGFEGIVCRKVNC